MVFVFGLRKNHKIIQIQIGRWTAIFKVLPSKS